MMARESVRACTVFSQWSREFGDQLQLQPNWELMSYKVDDLQTRFREFSMPKHWLPPSLTPLLRIIIYEYKNRFDEYVRKEAVLIEKMANIKTKLFQTQIYSQISPEDQASIKEIIEDESVNNDEDIARENQRLRTVIMQLEHKLNASSKPPSREHPGGRAFIVGAVHRIPSHPSMQRDFVGSIEDNRPFPHLTDEFSRGHSLDAALGDDLYRNSSTNGSSAKTIHENLKEENSPSKSLHVEFQSDNTRKKRSISFHQPLNDDTGLTFKSDPGRPFNDDHELSECSNRTTIENSEQTPSDIDSTVNSVVDNGDERDEITPTNSLTTLNNVNQLFDELREQGSRNEIKSAIDDERERSGTPASMQHYHNNAGATPFNRTPLGDERNESGQAGNISPQNYMVQITVNEACSKSDEEDVDEVKLKTKEIDEINEKEVLPDAAYTMNTINENEENVSSIENCSSDEQKLDDIKDFERSHRSAKQISNRITSSVDDADGKDMSRKSSTEPSQIQTPELGTKQVRGAILVNSDTSFEEHMETIDDTIRENNLHRNEDNNIHRKDSKSSTIHDELESDAKFSVITPLAECSCVEVENKVSADESLDINDEEETHDSDNIKESQENLSKDDIEDVDKKSIISVKNGSDVDFYARRGRPASMQSEESLPFRYEQALYENDGRTDSGTLSDTRKDSGALSELKRNLVDDAIHNAIDRFTPLTDAARRNETPHAFASDADNEMQKNSVDEENVTKKSISSEGTVEFNDSNQEYEESNDFFKHPSSSRLRKTSKESTIHEKNEENYVNNEAVDVGTKTYSMSTAQTSVNSHRRKATEFWELAAVLAQLLSVDLLAINRSRPSPSQSAAVIEQSTWRPSSWPSCGPPRQIASPPTVNELAARQEAADAILQKISTLLNDLASSH